MTMTIKGLGNDSQIPYWIKAWVLLSSILVIWDAGYCLLRPHSMEGGWLNLLWRPYNLYAKIDHFYGISALVSQDGFTGAQATMNVVETSLNLLYLWLLNQQKIDIGVANLVGFSAALMTLSKTVLYWLVEPFSGYQHIGHNNTKDLILLWIVPNGFWIVMPAAVVYTLGKDLISRLNDNSSYQKIKST